MLEDLKQFTGSTNFYQHWLHTIIYTDGTKYWAEEVGGYWLIDIVATEIQAIDDEFIFVVMTVKNDKAKIEASDGNGNIYLTKQIDFTDCPEGVHKFYLELNELGSKTLLLPSEH